MAAFYESGKYRVKIAKQAFGKNKKDNFELQLTIKPIGVYSKPNSPDEQLSEFDAPYERTIFLTLTEGTLGTTEKPGWVMQNLTYLGFNGDSFAQLDPNDKDAISFVGLELDARCDHEDYEGKEREKWNIIRPGGGASGPTTKPAEKKEVRALDSKFKSLLKANAKGRELATVGAGVVDPGDPPPPPAGRSDEEIPF